MEPVAQDSEVSDEVAIDIPGSAALTTSSDNHAAPFVAVVHASTPPEAAPPATKMTLALHVRLCAAHSEGIGRVFEDAGYLHAHGALAQPQPWPRFVDEHQRVGARQTFDAAAGAAGA